MMMQTNSTESNNDEDDDVNLALSIMISIGVKPPSRQPGTIDGGDNGHRRDDIGDVSCS